MTHFIIAIVRNAVPCINWRFARQNNRCLHVMFVVVVVYLVKDWDWGRALVAIVSLAHDEQNVAVMKLDSSLTVYNL